MPFHYLLYQNPPQCYQHQSGMDHTGRTRYNYLMGWQETDDKKEEPSKIIQYYNQLNDIGKHEAEKRVEELTYLPQYTLGIKAAHNDYLDEPGELEKMREDLLNLKRPDAGR